MSALCVRHSPTAMVTNLAVTASKNAIAATAAPTSFFDRGVHDVVGYLRLSALTVPSHLENAIEKFRYNPTVFIAPPRRDIYVQDKERKQSFDIAIETYNAMMKTYREYDYRLIELPCVSVEDRVDFMLPTIQSL